MMLNARLVAFVPCMLAVVVTTSFAQTSGPSAQPRDYGYVAALAGATFGQGSSADAPTSAMFAGEYGEWVTNNVQAHVTISYLDNLMATGLQDDLDTLSAGLTNLTGVPWSLSGRDRAVTLVAGGKYLFGESTIRPYLGAGVGIINIKRRIVDPRVGNVTSAVLSEFGVGDSELALEPQTRPLVQMGAGVAFAAGRATHVDIGYRFMKAFHLANAPDFSQLSIGIGYRF
jgi:opacity protein-like surface antigen